MTHEPPTGWDASSHPGLERLAELEEGLLDPADAARVTEHVAGCGHCRDEKAQLERTRTALRTVPAEQMPADVAARLDAVVAGAATTAPPAGQPATVVPLGGVRRRWRVRPAAAGLGAAAAVAVLVVALVVVGHDNGRSNRGGSGPAAQLAQAPAATALNDLNRTSTASGTNYTAGNLASTVPALIAGPAASAKSAPLSPSTGAGTSSNTAAAAGAAVFPAALARLHDSAAALRSCILGVEAGGKIERPLAIDFARYQGAPAVLVVLPGLNAGFVDAWFVGPACSDADAHLLGYKAIPASGSASPGG